MSDECPIDTVKFPGAGKFAEGETNDYVLMVGSALCLREAFRGFYQQGPTRTWTRSDQDAVRAFQVAQGWSGNGADGVPGPQTWDALGLGSAKSHRDK
jgi:murein L,D-transpeptidase YcbB/YkuD